MSSSYDTRTNRSVLNYLSKMRQNQNSNPAKFVQQFSQPETLLRAVTPLFGELNNDQGESRVRRPAIQIAGNNKISLAKNTKTSIYFKNKVSILNPNNL